jgi:AAA+ ATPase superfamily predicted ATPase
VGKSSLAMAMLNKSNQPRVFVHFYQNVEDGERNSARQDGRQ